MTTNMTLLGLGGLVLAAAGAFGLSGSKAERSDCPGQITCPITGEVICRDRCPNVDASRPDCPGRIECPQTGQLICVDHCPAIATADAGVGVPSCCRKKQ